MHAPSRATHGKKGRGGDARICAREQAGGAARRGHPSRVLFLARRAPLSAPGRHSQGPKKRDSGSEASDLRGASLVSSWHRSFLEEYAPRLE
ncbi:hypothetical protein MTO96_025766 [Rhipicephalus appendiculatus]